MCSETLSKVHEHAFIVVSGILELRDVLTADKMTAVFRGEQVKEMTLADVRGIRPHLNLLLLCNQKNVISSSEEEESFGISKSSSVPCFGLRM